MNVDEDDDSAPKRRRSESTNDAIMASEVPEGSADVLSQVIESVIKEWNPTTHPEGSKFRMCPR